MIRNLSWAAAAFVVLAFAAFWILTIPATVPASELGPHTPNLANGRTMFLAANCQGCHAVPKQADVTRLGGGLGFVTKFGTFYAPNISSDRKDGIGGWTEAQFVTAMKKGVSSEGEHLYPVFPYTSFQRITTGDLRDLFAYLKTLPAVSGQVRDADVAFPMNIRRLMGGWKLLYLDGKEFTPDPTQSAQWNRGAYLVNGPTHCAECHSTRNIAGAIETGKRFAGAPNTYGKLVGNLGFPNLRKAVKKFPEPGIAKMLRTGLTPDGDRLGGPMTDVIRSTSQLSEDDRNAMAVYIKSLSTVAAAAKDGSE